MRVKIIARKLWHGAELARFPATCNYIENELDGSNMGPIRLGDGCLGRLYVIEGSDMNAQQIGITLRANGFHKGIEVTIPNRGQDLD